MFETILTGKRNATLVFCQVRHVVHKHELHELTIIRTLSKASELFEFEAFCLSSMLIYMDILTAVTNFIYFWVIYMNILTGVTYFIFFWVIYQKYSM